MLRKNDPLEGRPWRINQLPDCAEKIECVNPCLKKALAGRAYDGKVVILSPANTTDDHAFAVIIPPGSKPQVQEEKLIRKTTT